MEANVISLILSVPPSANAMYRSERGRVHKSSAYRFWLKKARLAIREQMEEARAEMFRSTVGVHIEWCRKHRRGDLDNKCKPVLDSMKGLVFHDDRQVNRISMELTEGTGRDGLFVVVMATGVPA